MRIPDPEYRCDLAKSSANNSPLALTRCAATMALLSCLLSSMSGCSGASLPNTVRPAEQDSSSTQTLSWLSRAALQSFLDFNVAMGWRSGFVVSVARDGRVVHSLSSGYADIEAKRQFALDTRVRIASMTKPITAVAAMILIEDGRLGIDDPVEKYIPAASLARVATSHNKNSAGEISSAPLDRTLTVRHLLTFRSGIGWNEDSDLGSIWATHGLSGDNKGNLEQRVKHTFSNAPLFEQPGTAWRYGGSADVLGRVIEVASGQNFSEFLQQWLFDPLGMKATTFAKEGGDLSDLATMYTQDEEGRLVPTSAISHSIEWHSGGGGLISTANDYMRFALMLSNEGTYQGIQILKPETLLELRTAHVKEGGLQDMDSDGMGWGRGLGVVLDEDKTPMTDRNGDFWWAGFYDTKFFVSPSSGLAVVVLAQNQPSEYSGLPVATHAVQSFVYFGL